MKKVHQPKKNISAQKEQSQKPRLYYAKQSHIKSIQKRPVVTFLGLNSSEMDSHKVEKGAFLGIWVVKPNHDEII